MNQTDKKILGYLRRSIDIAGILVKSVENNRQFDNIVVEVAKLIQTEELNNSNMKYFEEKK